MLRLSGLFVQSTVQLVTDVSNNLTITALGCPIVLARYSIIYDGHVSSFILVVKEKTTINQEKIVESGTQL